MKQEKWREVVLRYVQGHGAEYMRTRGQIREILNEALAHDYRFWRASDDAPSNVVNLQKCIRDQAGNKLYFIDLHLWDMAVEFPRSDLPVNLSPKTQLHLDERHGPHSRTLNLSPFLTEYDTLGTIEAWFARAYKVLGGVPYETLYGDDGLPSRWQLLRETDEAEP